MGENLKKRLGEILIEDGVLTQSNLTEALEQQKKGGGLIGQLLIKLGYISEEDLVAAVARQLKKPYLPLGNYSVNSDALKGMSEEFCRKNQILVFDQNEKYIFVCLGDPLNEMAVAEIQKKTGLKPQVFISTPTEVLSMLDMVFGSSAGKHEYKKAG